MINSLIKSSRRTKILIVIFVDILTSIFATGLAFIVRLDLEDILIINLNLIYVFLISIALFVPIFYFYKIYNSIFRYFDLDSLQRLFIGVSIYSIPFFLVVYVYQLPDVPRSLSILQPLIFFIALFLNRLLLITLYNSQQSRQVTKKILIYGAGSAGVQAEKIISNLESCKIIGFVDDDKSKIGRSIYGYKIFSSDEINKIHKQNKINEIYIAITNIKTESKIKILREIETLNIKTRILPSLNELLKSNITISDFREISVLDLVERKVKIKSDTLGKEFEDKVILITGAGGSIGSQLSEQLLLFKPRLIILIDNTEYNLYLIDQKLKDLSEKQTINSKILTKLVDINNIEELDHLFRNNKPDYLFHAAAYKHVPIVEKNIIEALKNNFLGTINVIDTAIKHNCLNFVLISTDKAVRPTNVMGATKRLSEMYLQAISKSIISKGKYSYSIVRFGNVLDSSGSVVPLFRDQINSGGPVTVTHPEVTRYFMTIPEAATLILKSAVYAEGGEIFLLDMGEPVKILDLAKKMINLSGYSYDNTSEQNIDITFTGLRSGEKLHEELFIDKQNTQKITDDIFTTNEEFIELEKFIQIVDELKKIINSFDENIALSFLKENIKEFNHQNNKR